jgi:hypothetical protein
VGGAADEPCCPNQPVPSCQCDKIDDPALPPLVVEVPISGLAQDLVFTALQQTPSTKAMGLSPGAARAPPGLAAWRCVVLII